MPRFGLTLNLKDDPDVIEQYKRTIKMFGPKC